MTKTLTVEFHPEWKCWIAHTGGNDPWSGDYIGEGTTRAKALSDYWSQFHGMDKAARLVPPDEYCDQWILRSRTAAYAFDNQEEAEAFAEAREYLI